MLGCHRRGVLLATWWRCHGIRRQLYWTGWSDIDGCRFISQREPRERCGNPKRARVILGLVMFFVLSGTFATAELWWYYQTIARWKAVATYAKVVLAVAQALPQHHSCAGNRATLEISLGACKTLAMSITASRASEHASYLQNAKGSFRQTPAQPINPLVNAWLEAGLWGGLRFLCCERSGAVLDRNADAYYGFYFRVVDELAIQLYDTVATPSPSGLDEVPTDLLTAANRLAWELTDMFYRADISSAVRCIRSEQCCG